MHTSNYFYKDKPLFGLDVGFSSIKLMQLEPHGNKKRVLGYGVGTFDSKAIKDGVVVDHEALAKSIQQVFQKGIVGKINTRRVAVTIPATRTFTRTMNLPLIDDSELDEAVRLEAEQYIPMPLDELYLDFSVIGRSDKGLELLAVAVPKDIIDSYLTLVKMLGLEPVAFDTSILATGRLFSRQDIHNEIPAVLIDFGSISSDITVHDKTVIVTGTIGTGGDTYTQLIMKKLKISHQEAHLVKTKYGLSKSKKQKEILEAIEPSINDLVKEIRRMIRYHEERSGSQAKIGQVITMGGGANMPGLSEHLTDALRIPVRMCDPWENLVFGKLQPPGTLEKSIYVTVAGLSLIDPKELFV